MKRMRVKCGSLDAMFEVLAAYYDDCSESQNIVLIVKQHDEETFSFKNMLRLISSSSWEDLPVEVEIDDLQCNGSDILLSYYGKVTLKSMPYKIEDNDDPLERNLKVKLWLDFDRRPTIKQTQGVMTHEDKRLLCYKNELYRAGDRFQALIELIKNVTHDDSFFAATYSSLSLELNKLREELKAELGLEIL